MHSISNRAPSRYLLAGMACLCVAATAQADSRALKLGQVGVINQTLQPKPVHSSPGYNNPNNANSTYNANTINSNNGANMTNPGNNANTAYGRGGTSGTAGNNR